MKGILFALLLAMQSSGIAPYVPPGTWDQLPASVDPAAVPDNAEKVSLWQRGNEKLMWMLLKASEPPYNTGVVKLALKHYPGIQDVVVKALEGCRGRALWVQFKTQVASGLTYDNVRLIVENRGRQSQIWYGFIDSDQPDPAILDSMKSYCNAFNV